MSDTACDVLPTGVHANWMTAAIAMITRDGVVSRASLIEVKGSAPREVGASMLIGKDDIWQTIGGGTLEFDVMHTARTMMTARNATGWQRQIITAALGPDMGQCCGGQVRILIELFDHRALDWLRSVDDDRRLCIAHPLSGDEPPVTVTGDTPIGLSKNKGVFVAPVARALRPLFLYGAGHIGRALAPLLPALDLDVHWVDIAAERFPREMLPGVRQVIASDPAVIAAHAPAHAIHLVITHSHALDEVICHVILRGGSFARLGLIGSATKSARFRKRLASAGIAPAVVNRLICPIGLAAISGKAPARVALSIAAGVAIWQQELDA